MDTLLLIGSRRAAAEAARRAGALPLVLGGSRARRGVVQAPADLDGDPTAALAAAQGMLADLHPHAILPVTEAGVRFLARWGEQLRLPPGLQEVYQRCSDKRLMKRALTAAGVPVTRHMEVGPSTTPAQLVRALGLPLVLKPAGSSGSRGVRVARHLHEVDPVPGEMAEAFVDGVEMSVETFLSGGRVRFRNHTGYLLPGVANVLPADLTDAEREQVDGLVDAAHRALGITDGMTHAEVFLTSSGPVFGEVALRPPGGRIMPLIEAAYGFDPWRALATLSLGGEVEFPTQAKGFAGNWFLHPGPGRYRAVEGLEGARAEAGIVDVQCRLTPGDEVGLRLGTGQFVGFLEARGATFDECAVSLCRAEERLRFLPMAA